MAPHPQEHQAALEEPRERGAILVIVTLSLVILMGAAAMAVDLGWLYLNSLRIQGAADSAALAGVVHMPDNFSATAPHAVSTANASARTNGYIAGGGASVTVSPGYNIFQLRVDVEDDVETFFLRVFGIDSVAMSRHAIAEYVLPLPMGSPDNDFGNDPATGDFSGQFWGNIHGYFTGRGMGDRHSSQCVSWQSGSGCTKNPDRRETVWANPVVGQIGNATTGGYLYGVEMDAGMSGLAVELFDAPFTRGGGDNWLVGDNPQGASPGPTTVVILYGPDATPADTTDDNEVLCVATFSPRDAYADFNGDGSVDNGDDRDGDGDLDWDDVNHPTGLPGGAATLWDRMCGTTFNEGAGIYPLRVLTLDDGERGLNRWSLRTSASGGSPRVFGLGDMAIYANVNAGVTTFYMAEVAEVHAGKDLVIDLWDPGDAGGNHFMEVLTPQGGVATCDITSDAHGPSSGQCRVTTSGSIYNDHWVKMRIHLADDYTCAADCWWRIRYTYPAQTSDTTTWSAGIEGNPLRLVE